MADDMAKVRVTRTVLIAPNQTSTVLYEARAEPYLAPRAHIEQIVAAGAGEEAKLGEQKPQPAANPAPAQ
jgi:hypothetical protein